MLADLACRVAEMTIGNTGHHHAGGASPIVLPTFVTESSLVLSGTRITETLGFALRFSARLRKPATVRLVRKTMI